MFQDKVFTKNKVRLWKSVAKTVGRVMISLSKDLL